MAKIVLGTVQFGLPYGINNANGKPSEEQVSAILAYAYQSGIDTLDTADAYGNAAELIGAFHANSPQRFLVNTKFGPSQAGELHQKLAKSLQVLNVPGIDTYFYHSYSQYLSDDSLKKDLVALRSERKIKRIGLSVYTNEELKTAIADPLIDVIQLPFNPLDNNSQRGEWLRTAKQKGKHIQARSVFLQGLFFKQTDRFPVSLLPLKPYVESLQAIAAEAGVTMEELCLQYVNAQPQIDEIVIGVDSETQLRSNLASLRQPARPGINEQIDRILVQETSLLYPYNWT